MKGRKIPTKNNFITAYSLLEYTAASNEQSVKGCTDRRAGD